MEKRLKVKVKEIEEAIKEIDRELQQRKRVYPRLISSGKLHRDRANKQYKTLELAKNILQSLLPDGRPAPGQQIDLFLDHKNNTK